MRCMESLTALRIPKIDAKASCRSSAPSQPLLYFSISCSQKHPNGNLRASTEKHIINSAESNEWIHTFSSSWYLVILWTGFSRYESKPSLCSSFFWHSWRIMNITLCQTKPNVVLIHSCFVDLGDYWPGRRHSLSTASTGSQSEACCDSTSHRSAGLSSEPFTKGSVWFYVYFF